jgi:transposase InsO family protein
MAEVRVIGVDIAKSVFQLHGVDAAGATVLKKQLKRSRLLPFFEKLLSLLGRNRSLRHLAFLGARTHEAWSRGQADARSVCKAVRVRISMDGRGRWMDNVFIERLWRSLKYECVYLHAFDTGSELRAGHSRWIDYYNARRPHSTLAGRTADEAYGATAREKLAA